MLYLVDLITPPPGTDCQPDQSPFSQSHLVPNTAHLNGEQWGSLIALPRGNPVLQKAEVRDHREVNVSEIQAAFDDVFDQALVFHGFANYMRDYELFVHAAADPRTGIQPRHLRYRFKYCVRAVVMSSVSPEIWRRSLDERLVDYEEGRDLDGYVWGVKWQALYPGMALVQDSVDATRWSHDLGRAFYEATIGANGHNLSLIFSDLVVDTVDIGHAPYVVDDN